jgi:Tfp pilus assembly protein PilO
MDKKINLDFAAVKYLINRDKVYLIPVIIILVSVTLFFKFLIPEFKALGDAQQEAKELTQKLEVLKLNLNVLSNINEEVLNSQLKTLTSALPANKDVIKILNSVYSTAQKAGVTLGGFSFAIGDISKPKDIEDLPFVKLSVPINGDIIAAKSFIEIINRTVPLSGIDSIKLGDETSTLDLFFYYKPLDGSTYKLGDQIVPVSQPRLALISQLGGFEDGNSATLSGQAQAMTLPKVATSSGQTHPTVLPH